MKIKSSDPIEMAKWRQSADKAARHFKSGKMTYPDGVCKAAFVFDDGLVQIPVKKSDVETLTEKALADLIYQTAITAAQTGGSA